MGLLRTALTPFNLLVMALALVLGLAGIGALIASMKWRAVTAGWSRSLGTQDQLLVRYPQRGPDPAALELEPLAAALGVDVAPRHAKGRRTRDDLPSRRRLADRHRILGDYVNGQLADPDHIAASPPPEVDALLDERPEALAAVRAALGSASPDWGVDVSRPDAVPLPNLLGMLRLNRMLIADALRAAAAGDARRAAADLEASWNLAGSLREHPTVIAQLVAANFLRRQAGVLRKLDDVDPAWPERLDPRPVRRAFVEALRFEGWSWTTIPPREAFAAGPLVGRAAGFLIAPYTRYCLADASSRMRRRVDALADVETLCGADLEALGAGMKISVPEWNRVGAAMVPDLTGSVERIARLELDLELTARVVELHRAYGRTGRWPERLPGGSESTACASGSWSYDVAPDGSMRLELDDGIDWSEPARVLPTAHRHGPDATSPSSGRRSSSSRTQRASSVGV